MFFSAIEHRPQRDEIAKKHMPQGMSLKDARRCVEHLCHWMVLASATEEVLGGYLFKKTNMGILVYKATPAPTQYGAEEGRRIFKDNLLWEGWCPIRDEEEFFLFIEHMLEKENYLTRINAGELIKYQGWTM